MESGSHLYNKDRDVISKSESIQLGKQMAKDYNCSESEDWLQCLRSIDAKEFNKYTKTITYPVLGTDFVPISAQKAFQEMKFNSGLNEI
jgi:hypothetical protein